MAGAGLILAQVGPLGVPRKLAGRLSHPTKETPMTDDKMLARTDLERSIAEVKKLAENRGVDFTFGDMRHFTGANVGASVGNGDGTLISLLVGARGSLTRAAAKAAAETYQKLARAHPKAAIAIVMAGWDADPREIPDIAEAAEHFRRFARFAGLDGVRAALASRLHRDSVGLLAACGCFPEVDPDDVQIIGPPSTARH
jgi:hypothetical protein